MKIVTNTTFMSYRENDEIIATKKAMDLIKQAGFDAYDLSLTSMFDKKDSVFLGEDYLKKAQEIKDYSDELALPCYQSHAPFWHVKREKGLDEVSYYVYLCARAIEICGVVKCPIIVIHPLHDYNEQENHELVYAPLLEVAKRCNVKIATENMWTYDKEKTTIIHSACGTIESFCKQIDIANSEYLTGCVDLGHAEMQGIGCPTAPALIRAMGKDRVGCLHVHDNDLIHDSHIYPYFGQMDWDEIIKALKDIGYSNYFTFEAGQTLKRYPNELLLPALKLLYETGKYLVSRIEN